MNYSKISRESNLGEQCRLPKGSKNENEKSFSKLDQGQAQFGCEPSRKRAALFSYSAPKASRATVTAFNAAGKPA